MRGKACSEASEEPTRSEPGVSDAALGPCSSPPTRISILRPCALPRRLAAARSSGGECHLPTTRRRAPSSSSRPAPPQTRPFAHSQRGFVPRHGLCNLSVRCGAQALAPSPSSFSRLRLSTRLSTPPRRPSCPCRSSGNGARSRSSCSRSPSWEPRTPPRKARVRIGSSSRRRPSVASRTRSSNARSRRRRSSSLSRAHQGLQRDLRQRAPGHPRADLDDPERGPAERPDDAESPPATRVAWGFGERKARSMTDPDRRRSGHARRARDGRGPRRVLREDRQAVGPLHGVVMAIKDQYDTFDMRTTSGADAFWANDRPPDDATFVQKLRDAGAIILGKANMGEYAAGGITGTRSSFGGTICNAYDTERDPGASSGGSAVAVAANLVTCAIGEETGTRCASRPRTTMRSASRRPASSSAPTA
jgi:hypothetical protein